MKLPFSNCGEGRPRALPGRTALKQTERRSALSVCDFLLVPGAKFRKSHQKIIFED